MLPIPGAAAPACMEKRLGCTEIRRIAAKGCDSQTGAEGEGLHQSALPLQRSIDETERLKNRTKSKIRSRVEHAFWIIKGLFGFTKVRIEVWRKTFTACRYLRIGEPVHGSTPAVDG